METKYGHFLDEQFEEYKVVLHKKLFWLLLYKDPKTRDKYAYIDFQKCFENLMRRIDGLNSLLLYPKEIVEMMNNLEAAYLETQKEDFNYEVYRSLVLRAHSCVDKISVDRNRGVQHDDTQCV